MEPIRTPLILGYVHTIQLSLDISTRSSYRRSLSAIIERRQNLQAVVPPHYSWRSFHGTSSFLLGRPWREIQHARWNSPMFREF